MTRPATHGGGEAAPPIAGEPRSFPSDAELARTLVDVRRTATLSTLTEAGYPYGSIVSYVADLEGAPVVLISELAEHTVNLKGDSRASLLVADPADEGDPLGQARLTLVGRMQLLDDPGALRDRYLDAHPYAAYYADFDDFGFWRLAVEQVRYVGGFGHMSWATGDDYGTAEVDPVAGNARGAIDHMNEDHANSNAEIVRGLTELVDATEAVLVGLDRYGLTLRATTPAGPRMARVPFPTPLDDPGQIRSSVVALVSAARDGRAAGG
ncbi:MAG: DUF2470 domain-containing protein [Acidimicrobiia bacterium]